MASALRIASLLGVQPVIPHVLALSFPSLPRFPLSLSPLPPPPPPFRSILLLSLALSLKARRRRILSVAITRSRGQNEKLISSNRLEVHCHRSPWDNLTNEANVCTDSHGESSAREQKSMTAHVKHRPTRFAPS